MTPERFKTLQRLFLEACDQEKEKENLDAWIDLQCQGDEELADELRSMLAHNDRQETPLDKPALGDTAHYEVFANLPTSSSMPTISGYEISREIARGGQSVVYGAVQQSTGQRVAIKVLLGLEFSSPEERERQDREVRVLAKLVHPNIVGVVDRGRTESGIDYVVMPFVTGRPLDEHLLFLEQSPQEEKANSPVGAIELFSLVARTVGVAHHCGVVHRDLKPANIYVDEHGQPRILDFGLARILPQETTSEETSLFQVTVEGNFLGSLPWASPEQAAGEIKSIQPQTDVYSLGVVLYQMLTGGQFPYEVIGNVRDVLDNILHTEPKPPSSVNRKTLSSKPNQRALRSKHPRPLNGAIDAIVLKALSKSPADRYVDADAFADDVDRYLAGKPIVAKKRATSPRISRRIVALVGTFLAIGMLVFGFNYSRPGNDGSTSGLRPTVGKDKKIAKAEVTETIDRLIQQAGQQDLIKAHYTFASIPKGIFQSNAWRRNAATLEPFKKKVSFFFMKHPPVDLSTHWHFSDRASTAINKSALQLANIIRRDRVRRPRHSDGMGILRILLEDESLADKIFVQNRGLFLIERFSSSGYDTLDSGDFTMFENNDASTVMPMLQIGSLRHQSVNMPVAFGEGTVSNLGTIVLRRVPDHELSTLSLSLKSDTDNSEAKVRLCREGFWHGHEFNLSVDHNYDICVSPGDYRVYIEDLNVQGSTTEGIQAISGKTIDVPINVFEPKVVLLEWRYRKHNSQNVWVHSEQKLRTGKTYTSWPAGDLNPCSFGLEPWDGSSSDLYTRRCPLVRITDQELPIGSSKVEQIATLNSRSFGPESINEGDVFGMVCDRNEDQAWEFVVQVKQIISMDQWNKMDKSPYDSVSRNKQGEKPKGEEEHVGNTSQTKAQQIPTPFPSPTIRSVVSRTPMSRSALVSSPDELPGVTSWTIETRRPRGQILDLAWDPKGRFIASACADGAIRLHDPKTAMCITVLEGHKSYPVQIKISSDGAYLASRDSEDQLLLWSLADNRLMETLSSKGPFDFSDGCLIYDSLLPHVPMQEPAPSIPSMIQPSSQVGIAEGLKVVPLQKEKVPRDIHIWLSEQGYRSRPLCFSKNGLLASTQGGPFARSQNDSTLQIHNWSTLDLRWRIELDWPERVWDPSVSLLNPTETPVHASFSPNERYLVLTDRDRPTHVVAFSPKTEEHTVYIDDEPFYAIGTPKWISPAQVVLINIQGKVVVWDVQENEQVLNTSIPAETFAISPGAERVAYTQDGLCINNLGADANDEEVIYDSIGQPFNRIELSGNGKEFCLLGQNGEAVIDSFSGGISSDKYYGPMFFIQAGQLFSVSWDGLETLWGLPEGGLLISGGESCGPIGLDWKELTAAKISLDGNVIGAWVDGEVKFIEYGLCKNEWTSEVFGPLNQRDIERFHSFSTDISPLASHKRQYTDCFSFSQDATRVAIAGMLDEGTACVEIYHTLSGLSLRRFTTASRTSGSRSNGVDLKLSPDGKAIAWRDESGQVWAGQIESPILKKVGSDPFLLVSNEKAAAFSTGTQLLQWSYDSKRLTLLSGDRVEIWNVAGERFHSVRSPKVLDAGNFNYPSLCVGGLVAAEVGRSRCRLWDTGSGEPLSTLFFDSNDFWMIISPEGHYTGSSGAVEPDESLATIRENFSSANRSSPREEVERDNTPIFKSWPDVYARGIKDLDYELVYVVMKNDGSQQTLTPKEFTEEYGWKNRPGMASRGICGDNEAEPTLPEMPEDPTSLLSAKGNTKPSLLPSGGALQDSPRDPSLPKRPSQTRPAERESRFERRNLLDWRPYQPPQG